MSEGSDTPNRAQQLQALYKAARFRPKLSGGIVVASALVAMLEGIGLTFLLPIIQITQNPDAASTAGGETGLFVRAFNAIGLPFTLENVIIGAALILTVRYVSSFLVGWARAALAEGLVEDVQTEAFENGLGANIDYYDSQGSDSILNAIVTEARFAGDVLRGSVRLLEQVLITGVYLSIALYISPLLTVLALVVLGGITYLLRSVVEPAASLGDAVAEANDEIQRAAQAGIQGIREVKLFGLGSELFEDFREAVSRRKHSSVTLNRNKAAIDNFYNLATAVTLFVLIYVALEFSDLSLAALGVFLLAMFRLAPRASNLNNMFYNIEGNLPHLVRTEALIDEMRARADPSDGDTPVPRSVDRVEFDDVTFSYDGSTPVIQGLDLSVSGDEFAAFVGSSGAGKSTLVGLLTRMYEPDSGEIRVNGVSIAEMDIQMWRDHISVVTQDPFIFNDSLRRNLTIGNRGASMDAIEEVCTIAQVTEFLEELPDGYETELGENGVRLSGGQKQRVALARALLEDSDVLILDEATSDLDANIEQTVQTGIEAMDRTYATFVIAHRLSTVMNADRIYTVADGRIVESGSHSELIAQGGTYSSLYETQARSG
jgi:subfamily B ATP-binding cassette protein MsbA